MANKNPKPSGYAVTDGEVNSDLVLFQAFVGFHHLLSKNGSTELTLSEPCFIPSVPKAVWLENQLPLWTEQLAKFTGGKVLKANLQRPFNRPDRYGNYETIRPQLGQGKCCGQLVVKLKLPGSIVLDSIGDEEIAKGFSGFAKKQLALWIIRNCEVPFDRFSPIIAAGSLDYFHIDGRTCRSTSDDEEAKRKNEIFEAIAEMLFSHGAELVKVTCANTFTHYHMTIRWRQDTTEAVREALKYNTKRIFREKFGYEPDVYLWVW